MLINCLCKYQLQHGHVPDTEYDRLGFAEDLDPNDAVVRRDEGITREPYQRAKTLSHDYQCKLRLELKQQAQAAVEAKLVGVQERTNKIFEMNNRCQSKLCTLLGEPTTSNGMMFSNCTIEHFTKCTNDERKAFIHCREFDSHLIPKSLNWTWPKRDGLIQLAYDRRSLPKQSVTERYIRYCSS